MRVRAVSTGLLLLLCAGCPSGARTPADTTLATSGAAVPAISDARTALTDRAWIRSDSTGLPGVMLIFLRDGTLLMDSCWVTYRLARWARGSGNQVSWNEDGQDIRAEVLSLSDQELTVRLNLPGGAEDQHYKAAATAYVCPEMRR